MKNNGNNSKLVTVGLVAAVGASLCCITPILALVAGIGGVASTFSWLDPFRPYLIGLTGIVLAFAWYQKLKTGNEALACECEDDKEKKAFVQSKTFLGVVTVFAILLLSFPYYSSTFFSNPANKAVAEAAQPAQLRQARLGVKGMTCRGCESHVTHALSSKKGVMEATASYEDGMANVTYDPGLVTPDILKKAIEEEVGYSVNSLELIDIKKE